MADTVAEADRPENEAPTDKSRQVLGPILAVAVVVALGAGLAAVGLPFLLPAEAKKEAVAHETPAAVAASDEEVDLHQDVMIDMKEIMANPRKSELRRYVKVNVQLWITKADAAKIKQPGLLEIMGEALETRLHSFDIQELNSEFIHTQIKRSFRDELNRELRRVLHPEDPQHIYVKRVVLNNLLVQ